MPALADPYLVRKWLKDAVKEGETGRLSEVLVKHKDVAASLVDQINDEHNNSLLSHAIIHDVPGRLEVVRMLLQYSDVDRRNKQGSTPLSEGVSVELT